jgi:hypothetical protein
MWIKILATVMPGITFESRKHAITCRKTELVAHSLQRKTLLVDQLSGVGEPSGRFIGIIEIV